MRPLLALAAVLALLWGVHAAATWRTGFVLQEGTRQAFGASAQTLVTRLYAHFTAPFFHDSLGHLLYNTALLAVALPLAVRAFGGSAVGVAYLASPAVGILVDALIILPLAAAGVEYAQEAAPVRLVGASVVAFALIGMTLGARGGAWVAWVVAGLVLYELTLAGTGTTKPFVFAFHLGGLGVGLLAARLLEG